MGINTTNARATTAFGYSGNLVSTKEQDFMALYQVLSLGDSVQYDAQIQAEGFQDLRATSGINLLYALMEQEDIVLLGGQNYALATPGTPSLTVSTTGGSIGAVNVAVAVAVRTMQGYFDGKGGIASAQATTGVLSGSTNTVTATVPAVAGAVVYDWYVGTQGGTLYWYTSTSNNKVTITSVPVAAASIATVIANANNTLSMLAAPVNTTAQAAVSDATADPNSVNGLLATLTGDYSGGNFVQRGTGTPSGSYWKSLDGATMTGNNGTIVEIDAALQYLWGNAKVSPTKFLVNSVDHVNMSNKIIASGGVYTTYKPDQLNERQNVIGGQIVDTYLNKAVNGRPIAIETHPWLPQGTIIGVTEKLPYPNNKVANVLEVETLLEYQQIEYAVSRNAGAAGGGPRYDFEVRCQEAFKNYFPGSMFVLQNVANG